MAWTTFTTAQMDAIARRLFMPLILMVNYTLLQYLLMFYWVRRHQRRVLLLFAVGSLGVACLVPFADPDDDTVSHLNEVSESCCVLTFLLQITIIGYDLNKRIKFRTIMALTYVAEILIVVDLVMVLLSLANAIIEDVFNHELVELLNGLCENITLAFIFVFRYYYIIISLGWRDVWANRRLEIGCYLLYATHGVPFTVLENVSGLSWGSSQALWNRVTLAGCLWITARTKLRNSSGGGSTGSAANTTSPPSRRQASLGRVRNGNAYVVAVKNMNQHGGRKLADALKSKIAVLNE